MPAYHLIITGKVQGVFYRASAKQKAIELGITGWIKNTREGNVEAEAYGDEPQLQKFIHWCKLGPDKAVVKEVIVSNAEYKDYKTFIIVE